MRLIILADGYVGLKFVKFLIENYRNDIGLIVTIDKNEIFSEAENEDINVCCFESEKKVLDLIDYTLDLGILAWWPKILKKPLLNLPQYGFLNTHPSLLPYNRGKHYNFWAIVEKVPFGVTIHRVSDRVDCGEIVTQSSIDYDWSDTGETLYYKAQKAMLSLLVNTYPNLRSGEFEYFSQNLEDGSFHLASEIENASKIELDKLYLAKDLLNLLRARTFEGHPGCWFDDDGERYEISIKIRKII